jgi:tetratricopeptide (TPR) repeat protein
VAQDFPILGTGVGTHADAHQLHLDKPIEGGEFTHAESGYLQVMSETGFVGLGLGALFIVVSLWWCCGALRNPDARVSSIAAVVLASLLANLAHAVGDFFWYTPSCMLLLAIQLACACRLYRMTRESSGYAVRTWQVPRLVLWPLSGGVLAAAVWMVFLKLPAALAEPDRMRYITIAMAGPDFYVDDEDRRTAQHEKRQAAFRAARLDPHDSRLQEQAALAYVEWFDERQEQSENPLPLRQLRDAIQASQFESTEAMHEWLDRAVGKNVKLLRIAKKYLCRSLRESPLRVRSYVQLAELSFLEASSAEVESAYLKQAATLRPRDAEVLFAVGRNDLLAGDLDQAMDSWRVAFEHSKRMRAVIADLLAGQVTPEFFLDKLKPDWASIGLLAQAFTKAGREEEARQMWVQFVSDGRQRLKTSLPDIEYQAAVLGLRSAYLAMNEPDEAIRITTRGLKRLPYSFPLRQSLGMDLSAENRFVEAAEHLQWCAARQPDNKALQQAAARATKERLKSDSAVETKIGSVSQTGAAR